MNVLLIEKEMGRCCFIKKWQNSDFKQDLVQVGGNQGKFDLIVQSNIT